MRPSFIRFSGGLFIIVGLISAFARAAETGGTVCELKRTEAEVEFDSSALKANRDFYEDLIAKARPHAEVMARNLNQIYASLSAEERETLRSQKREALEIANRKLARIISEDESHLIHFDCGADFSGRIETVEGKLYCNPRWHRHYPVPSFSTIRLLHTDDGSTVISLSHKNDLLPSGEMTAHFVASSRELGQSIDSEKIARTLLRLNGASRDNPDVNEDPTPSREAREPISRAEYVRDQMARRAPHCLAPGESRAITGPDPKATAGHTSGSLPIFIEFINDVMGSAGVQR